MLWQKNKWTRFNFTPVLPRVDDKFKGTILISGTIRSMPASSNHKFKSITDIVAEVVNKHLPAGDINALSKQLDRIISCWPNCCSEHLSQNVKPVRLDENVLILETHSPVWANKMRYCVKSTLVRLNQLGFNQIDTLKIKVNPRISTENRKFT